jgi:hypothetical protein
MSTIKKMLETAWSEFKSDYRDAEKCEEEFLEKGRKRTAEKYAYYPWNEFDARFMFARKIEELYIKAELKAEIHINWDLYNWRGSDEFRDKVETVSLKGEEFDMLISSPYSLYNIPTFDALMEFKMYRKGGDFHPWKRLEPKVKALMKVRGMKVKEIKVAKEVAVALINEQGMSRNKWDELLTNLSSYEDKGLVLLKFDTERDT